MAFPQEIKDGYNTLTPSSVASSSSPTAIPSSTHRKYSISYDNANNNLGRSFVYSSFRLSSPMGSALDGRRDMASSPTIHSGKSIHETTVELATVGIDEENGGEEDDERDESDANHMDQDSSQWDEEEAITEGYSSSATQNNSLPIADHFHSSFKGSSSIPQQPQQQLSIEDQTEHPSHSKLSDLIESNKSSIQNPAAGTSIPSISYPSGSFNGSSSPTSPGQALQKHQKQRVSSAKETDPILSSSPLESTASYHAIGPDSQMDAHHHSFNSTSNFDVESQFMYSPALAHPSTANPHLNKQTFSWSLFYNSVKSKSKEELFEECVTKPIGYLPPVFLGVLLNILDGLSYGMIMFPIGESVFSSMGPHGLSMFYLSCVISQLVYSLGGSAFKSGIGSEMIEVTPFFHSMALSIMSSIGDPDLNQDEIITTTIFTFAISSIVTGIVFFVLGYFKLGKLVGFFPRHILVGCIGGVGYFLVITGIEVSSRLEGGLSYNFPTFQYLFMQPMVLLQWVIPLLLTVLLIFIQKYQKNAIIVPLFFIVIFVIFHLLVLLVPTWNLPMVRDLGWCFKSPETNEPWFSFYKFYNFKKANWWCIAEQIPTMFALTFFGILHVPINVPALAVTLEMDEFDVDRELIAHGISNSLSGLFGSIQNYLVYTNTVLFIRAGADSRLSGVMLACATAIVMFIGPVLIGFIPVCVVGSLIYLLGYELLKEALWDTRGRLRKFEYITVFIIVIAMGVWDFVYGILVGVLLACTSFVVEAARRPVISGIYTGDFARSIVIRHPKQQEFLRQVGKQIYIMKLQGSLFFGSIGGLEEKVRERFDNVNFAKNPIRYLIFDMTNVYSIDFSAAEGFRRIRNLVIERNCFFLITGLSEDNDYNEDGFIIKSLKDSGLWEIEEHSKRIQLFNNLNSGLEWCENKFLEKYKDFSKKRGDRDKERSRNKSIAGSNHPMSMAMSSVTNRSPNGSVNAVNRKITSIMDDNLYIASPRDLHVLKMARKVDETYRKHNPSITDSSPNTISTTRRKSSATIAGNQPYPIPLIISMMQGLSNKKDHFWYKLPKYLQKLSYKGDFQEIIYDNTNNRSSLFFVETGLVKSTITMNDWINDKTAKGFEQDDSRGDGSNVIEINVLPLTIFGDIVEYQKNRQVKYFTNDEKDETIIWKLSHENLMLLQEEHPEIYNELLVISITLIQKRFELLSNNLVLGNYLKN